MATPLEPEVHAQTDDRAQEGSGTKVRKHQKGKENMPQYHGQANWSKGPNQQKIRKPSR